MTSKTIHNKKQNNHKNRLGKIAAEVAGAAVVAGVAVAATMVLKDEKNRKKINKALTNAKNEVTDYVDMLKTESKEEDYMAKKTTEKIIKGGEKNGIN